VAAGLRDEAGVASAGRALVALSPAWSAADRDIKGFLFAHVYRHPNVMRVRAKADAVVRRLFAAYATDATALPPEWAARARVGGAAQAASDYIAGMTDRFAIQEHRRLFDEAPELR
jgi:dGTPase